MNKVLNVNVLTVTKTQNSVRILTDKSVPSKGHFITKEEHSFRLLTFSEFFSSFFSEYSEKFFVYVCLMSFFCNKCNLFICNLSVDNLFVHL